MNKKKIINIILLVLGIIVILGMLGFFYKEILPLLVTKRTKMVMAGAFGLMVAGLIYVWRRTLGTGTSVLAKGQDVCLRPAAIFTVLVIIWGIVYQIVMPPLSGTDEWAHYTSAYYLSDKIMGTMSLDNETDVTVYHYDGTFETVRSTKGLKTKNELPLLVMRKCDVPCAPPSLNFPQQYDNLSNGHIRASAEEKELVGVQYTYYTPWIRYIPVGIGITLGRLLGLSGVLTLYLGRFMNTLLFLLIGLLVIKIIPFGKMQVVSFSMLPVLLASVTSYTYDAISISLCMLVVAMCMHYSKEDVELKIWDVLFIVITFMFLVPNKGVYSLFAILLFMIPFKKWKVAGQKTLEKTSGKIAAIVVVVSAIGIFVWKILPSFVTFFKIFSRSGGTTSEMVTDTEAWTLGYAMAHKEETALAWVHTFTRYSWIHLKQVLGLQPGHHNLELKTPEVCIVLLLIVLIASLVLQKGNRVPKKYRIIWNVTAFIVVIGIVAGCMVRFTPAGHGSIAVSYRYYLPVFMAGMLFYSTDEEATENAMRCIYLQYLLLIPITCSILYQILTFTFK